VSLNVAGDNDDDDGDDVHMACFSSRSLQRLLSFILSFVFNFSVICRKENLLLSVAYRQEHDFRFLFKI
jgi:hypothetical protein